MSIRVHVGGQILPPESARVSVFDRGYLYGDSVYETLVTSGGRLFALSEHMDRLERSAHLLGIALAPTARAEIEAAVHATVAAAGNPESRVRIIISRGEGVWGDLDPAAADRANSPTPGDPAGLASRLVVIAGPRGGPTQQMYADGVSVAIVSVQHQHPRTLDPAAKSGNYLPGVLAVGEARRLGAYEAILCAADGGIAEGASSNVFVVKQGRVRTPAVAVGILAGITRGHVLALCRQAGIPAEEVAFLPADELHSADEAFLTSAGRGVLPVTAVDGQTLGTGRPGPVSMRLVRLYEAFTRGQDPEKGTV
jgi:branched-chain amino acid aminotransferase